MFEVPVKNIKFETHMVFNLSNKDPITTRALKTKLSFKSFGKYLRKITCFEISLL